MKEALQSHIDPTMVPTENWGMEARDWSAGGAVELHWQDFGTIARTRTHTHIQRSDIDCESVQDRLRSWLVKIKKKEIKKEMELHWKTWQLMIHNHWWRITCDIQ